MKSTRRRWAPSDQRRNLVARNFDLGAVPTTTKAAFIGVLGTTVVAAFKSFWQGLAGLPETPKTVELESNGALGIDSE